ncbi:MAG TPA: ATP-binding protein [Miltoncostaeaceae bacterium]|nr:ATP-binding protein [Miltoncostaeaceae bacterium]
MPQRPLLSLALPPAPASVVTARRRLEEVLDPLLADGLVSAATRDTAVLLVSELVTNAVRHARTGAGARVELQVALTNAHRLHVSVHDEGQGFTATRVAMPPPEQIGGRGLALVDAMAEDWGAERVGSMRVWFELPLEPAS